MIYLFLGNKTHILVLYIAAALFGFMLGGQAVIMAQLFKECVPDENKRASFLGYGNSVVSLGGVIMATLGGIIAAKNNGIYWERAFLLYFWMIIVLIIEIICLPSKPKSSVQMQDEETKTSRRLPLKVWLISIHYFFFFLALYAFSLNVSEYVITTHHLGTSAESGLALSCLTVGGIFSGLAFGLYSKILKEKTMFVLLAICTGGLALIVLIPNLYVLYVASAMLGFAMMGANPYVMMELSRITDKDGYAKAMSIFAGFMNGGMMFAVYILAFLANMFFGDPNSVNGKFMIAFVGLILVTLTSIPIYMKKTK